MKIIIAGGGTGGHLFSGIALAEELRANAGFKQNDIIFVGTEHGIEGRVIPKEGYPIKFIRAQGFVGKSIFRKISSLALFLLGIYDSKRIFNSLKPDVVIGIGGYASVAMLLVAHFKGAPTIILEQNSIPGMANKFLGRFADAIAVTYQESISYFPNYKTYLTGNPVRRNIIKRIEQPDYSIFSLDKGIFTILVFGGSAGASSINHAMIDALHHLPDLKKNIQIIHQTGTKDYDKVNEAYTRHNLKVFAAPFLYDMAEAYNLADLVICRAGASTLAEITAVGRAAILIPYPFAAGGHQEANARKMADIGAAKIILDKELDGQILAKTIRYLYNENKTRMEMQKVSGALGKIDAGEKIVKIVFSIAKKK
jgi:UDP-N-acetylglucosamine--N-acetylmuramyl-(pentapeptide) pyrophosphoryl-undecaprenol N-acetylglucosamine transferase